MRETLFVGDALDFPVEVADYSAADGWTLTYRLVPQVSGTVISFDATADGTGWRAEVSSTTTATWTAGTYAWFASVSKAGERATVDSGTVTIKPNPATATTSDNRTHARKMLDAIEAALEQRATRDQLDLIELSIYSRTTRRGPAVLLEARNRYTIEVQREAAAAGLRPGAGRVLVRF